VLGLGALVVLAGHADLQARDWHRGERCFVELCRAAP